MSHNLCSTCYQATKRLSRSFTRDQACPTTSPAPQHRHSMIQFNVHIQGPFPRLVSQLLASHLHDIELTVSTSAHQQSKEPAACDDTSTPKTYVQRQALSLTSQFKSVHFSQCPQLPQTILPHIDNLSNQRVQTAVGPLRGRCDSL